MRIIDTHAHLYLEDFDSDRVEVITRARDAGVARIYLPNINASTIQSMYALEEKTDGYCSALMGLHPCYVKNDYRKELDTIYKELSRRKFSGMGEIGLDLYWDQGTLREQIEAFETQITWAIELDLPFVIHSRESTSEILALLEKKGQKYKGIFHCFSGTEEQALRIIALGFHLGIGGVFTFKNSSLKEAIANIPLNNIVFETDAPYLSPVPYRGKRNESSYLPLIVESYANHFGLSLEEVSRSSSENAHFIFKDNLTFK
jgi:TatD DNase family protein